jgi:hypothetical protein
LQPSIDHPKLFTLRISKSLPFRSYRMCTRRRSLVPLQKPVHAAWRPRSFAHGKGSH